MSDKMKNSEKIVSYKCVQHDGTKNPEQDIFYNIFFENGLKEKKIKKIIIIKHVK